MSTDTAVEGHWPRRERTRWAPFPLFSIASHPISQSCQKIISLSNLPQMQSANARFNAAAFTVAFAAVFITALKRYPNWWREGNTVPSLPDWKPHTPPQSDKDSNTRRTSIDTNSMSAVPRRTARQGSRKEDKDEREEDKDNMTVSPRRTAMGQDEEPGTEIEVNCHNSFGIFNNQIGSAIGGGVGDRWQAKRGSRLSQSNRFRHWWRCQRPGAGKERLRFVHQMCPITKDRVT